jgi:phenylalanyl-tRNA synthetase alpha chain
MTGGAHHDGSASVSDDLLSSLHPLEVKALPHLKDGMLQSELCTAANMQDVEATRALQWLENKGAVTTTQENETEATIEENGKKAAKTGMPETRFLLAVRAGASTQSDIAKAAGLDPQECGVSIGLLKKRGLIAVAADSTITATQDGMTLDTNLDASIGLLRKLEKHPMSVDKLTSIERTALDSLKARKAYVSLREGKDRRIVLTAIGSALARIDVATLKLADRITPEDLATGAWKEKRYRSFDVTAPVPKAYHGKAHFVNDAMDRCRRIWIEMGFQEMEGDIVQSAFWNLDALFVPQDHPARELQDTFYLEHPAKTQVDRAALERVKAVHENGGNTGSKGWQTPFSRDISEQLLLRTHTTVLSAQTLWKIKEGKLPMPGKYFAIGKCFRNESVDWSHLFEFNQVEGIVVDKDVTFAQLLGYLRIFFTKMGYPDIRLRPHYFPYTEPSVEIDVWHPVRKKWVELGGAGVFRPEVSKALLGEEIPILAWGPGFDRIIVEYFGITDLRDMYNNDIERLRSAKKFLL